MILIRLIHIVCVRWAVRPGCVFPRVCLCLCERLWTRCLYVAVASGRTDAHASLSSFKWRGHNGTNTTAAPLHARPHRCARAYTRAGLCMRACLLRSPRCARATSVRARAFGRSCVYVGKVCAYAGGGGTLNKQPSTHPLESSNGSSWANVSCFRYNCRLWLNCLSYTSQHNERTDPLLVTSRDKCNVFSPLGLPSL